MSVIPYIIHVHLPTGRHTPLRITRRGIDWSTLMPILPSSWTGGPSPPSPLDIGPPSDEGTFTQSQVHTLQALILHLHLLTIQPSP